MIPEQFRQFMQDLKHATETGKARWETSLINGYTCEKDEFSFGIWHQRHEHNGMDVIGFTVSAPSGRTRFLVEGDEADFANMSDIYAAASAAANRFPERLKNLFRA